MAAADFPSDPYRVLGVSPAATAAEIKAAYRALVKRHHPDAGGDDRTILELNAAWEVLGDGDRRRHHDHRHQPVAAAEPGGSGAAVKRGRAQPGRSAVQDTALQQWLQLVHAPIDRLLAQVINPFPSQLKALSADPYDDSLMEAFCTFLEQGQARLEKVESLYQSQPCPPGSQAFALDLYHCLSLAKDALAELERYTMGYVDSYLHDGRELLRQARLLRQGLQAQRRELGL
ncbi:J domain-containing protein [Cyanobium sp. FACHB-13342]|uniref:J domain-containing protein n=1 Tax=Cyanobium sp. FACHB-13342 TaxID=2692793 RepID=UPI00167FF8FE|nr:J domain-containing protein [Cyanobium sp. FACHB-13342]MBD2423625.1 DnaJ domain-containing protein [Cyanobium sp. FACHB-13342]